MPPIILEPAPLGPPASSRRASSSSSSYAFQTTTPKSVHQKRATYYAVKTGHRTGVFETWEEAERMIKGHPAPQFKAFKTYMAAEAFVAGRDGSSFVVASRPNVPLTEHLKSFPPSTPLSSPTPAASASASFAGPSTRQRPRAEPSTEWTPSTAVSPLDGPLKPPRPAFARSRTSSSSPIRRSSPLRQEVTDDEAPRASDGDAGWTSGSESDSLASPSDRASGSKAGWLSPPTSPETSRAGAAGQRTSLQRPMAAHVRPASPSADIPTTVARPANHRASSSRSQLPASGASTPPAGGLWADVVPLSPPTSPINTAAPAEGTDDFGLDLASHAPRFSRNAMKRQSNVVMPVSAKAMSPTSSRPGSRLVSPRTSHGDLKAVSGISPGAGSSIGADHRRSLPTGRSLKALHEKLVALSSPSRDDLHDPLGDSPDSLLPKMSAMRTVSSGSIASILSDASDASFVSTTSSPVDHRLSTIAEAIVPGRPAAASGQHLAVPVGLSITPLTSATQADEPDVMSPLTLAPSSQSSHGGSVATHVQSEHASGRFGRRKGSGSSSPSAGGIGKKILKVFGFSSRTESKANQARRASN